MLPITITLEVASRLIHDATPILQTLKPAISQIIPAMEVRDLVFILTALFCLCYA